MKKNSNTLPLNMTALAIALFVIGISFIVFSPSTDENNRRLGPVHEDYAARRLIDEGPFPGKPLVTDRSDQPNCSDNLISCVIESLQF